MIALVTALLMPFAAPCCEVSLGASGLLYYAAFSNDATLSLDAAVRMPLGERFALTGGARLALGTVRVEGYGRFEVAPRIGVWRPTTGVELGVTSRAYYEDGDGVVGALARLSRRDLIPLYAGLHAAPLRFALGDHWTLSFAEIAIGTELAPAGRYVRLGVSLFMLGVTP